MEDYKELKKELGRLSAIGRRGELSESGEDLVKQIEHALNRIEELESLKDECRVQLEYLNEKFGETGTTNSLLTRLKQ